MLTTDWGTLCAALVSIEQLGEGASGLLSFGPAPNGGIFVERGRVCWVAATGFERRLRDLLRLPSAELDRVYETCRVEGRFLGQTLVEEGRIGPSEFEQALRRHSAECLVDLCRGPKSLSWSPRRGRGYAPRFTFRAVELLFDAVALRGPDLRSVAEQELSALEAPGRSGAAFFVDAGAQTVVPLIDLSGRLGVERLSKLGQWALSLFRASREFGAHTQFTLASTGLETLAVWWRDSLLFVVCCDDRASVAAVAAHHLGKS
jgi:hypothetical protein